MPKWLLMTEKSTQYKGVREFAEKANTCLEKAHDAIIESQVKQTYQANKHRRESPEYKEGSLVYLSRKNLSLPKGRAKKLLPRFV